jgi:hypothetical protein
MKLFKSGQDRHGTSFAARFRGRVRMSRTLAGDPKPDPALHQGVVEGNDSSGEGYSNPNAPALDAEGLPNDAIAIAEDRIGANVDDPEVANADERGGTTTDPRDEVQPLVNEDSKTR